MNAADTMRKQQAKIKALCATITSAATSTSAARATWADAETLQDIAQRLQDIADSVTKSGEYAEE